MSSEPSPWLELGNVVVYERRPAEGGMGQVYRGHHPILGQVAVKLIHERHRNGPRFAAYRARFRMEAEALGEIQGPHVVRLLDFGETAKFGDDYGPYIVMEYLEGHTLDSRRQENGGHIEPAQGLKIAAQIADALALIHSKGYVYCDLNPRNIYLIVRGNDHQFVKLLDLGLVHLASEATHPTEGGAPPPSNDTDLDARSPPDRGQRSYTLPSPDTAQVLPPSTSEPRYHPTSGAPGHMAPEQLRGEPATFHTDVHAVGRVLFEMLTGRNWMDDVRGPAVRKERNLGRSDQRVFEDHLPPPQARKLVKPALERHVLSSRLRASLGELLSTCLSDDPASRSHQKNPEESMSALSRALRSNAPLAGDGVPPRSKLHLAGFLALVLASGAVASLVWTPRSALLRVEGSETIGEYLMPEMIPYFLQYERATSWQSESTLRPERHVFKTDLPGRGRVVVEVVATGSFPAAEQNVEVRMVASRKEDLKLPPQYEPNEIGSDVLVPIVATGSDVKGITWKELRGIFTGEVTNWSQIKGSDHSGEILVHIPEKRHGTHVALATMLDLRELERGTTHVVLHEISSLVANTPTAIGFIGLALAGSAKVLCVTAKNSTVYVSPTQADYPFRRQLFLAVNTSSPQAELANKLVEYAVREQSQQLLVNLGYFDKQGHSRAVGVECPKEGDRR